MSGMDEAIEYERSLFNDMHPLYQIMGYYDQWVPGEKVQKIFQALERWQKDVASISEKHSDKIMKMVFDACGVTFFEQWGWLEKVISSEVLNECSWQNWEVKFSQKGCEFRCQKAIFCVESLDNIHDWHQVFWWISKGVKGQRTSHLRLSKSLGICPDLNQPMLISEQWIDHIISGTLLTVRDKIDTDGLGVLAQWLMVQHENGALKFHEVSEFIKYHLLSEYRGGETHLTGRMSQQGERWVLFVPILERNIIFDQENIGRQMIDIKNTLVKQLDLMRHSAQEKLVSFMSRHFPFLVYEYQWQGIHLVLNIGEFSKELQEATWRLWAPLDQEKLKWEIREHLSQTAPLLLLKQSFYGYELQFKAIADLLQLLNMPKVSGELLWYYQFGITVFQAPARYHVYDIHLNKAVSEDDMTTVLGNLESSGFSMFKVKQDWCANHHDLKIRIMLHQHETQLAQDLKSLRELEAGSDSWVQKDLTDWDVIMKCRFAQLMGESFSFGQLDEWLRGWSHTQLFLLCHRYSDAYLNLPGMLGDYIYQRIVLKPSLREEKSFEEWLEIIKNDLDERHQGGFVSELIQALGYTEMTMRLGT
jgi:hypothetical protein